MEEQDLSSAKAPAQPSEPRFGERVEIDGAPREVLELGSFPTADRDGNVYSVTVREERYGSAKASADALRYSFEETVTGKFKQPVFLSFLVFAFNISLMVFAVMMLTDSLPQLPFSPWVIWGVLLVAALGSTMLQSRRVNRILRLVASGNILRGLEARSSGEPLLDIPKGRTDALRALVESTLADLPSVTGGKVSPEVLLASSRGEEANGAA